MRRWSVVVWSLALLACDAGTSSPTPDASEADASSGPCARDEECDDGTFCNGVELCQPASSAADGRGCAPAPSAPCAADRICDEASARCETDCAIATDADGDGAIAIECGGDDCDDADARVAPGAVEVCDDAGLDEDCDPSTLGDVDTDGDGAIDARCCNGASCGTDCDDARRDVRPGVTERCDGIDDDCDGMVDEGVMLMGFADEDRDLHGDPSAPRVACLGASGFSLEDDDCDDASPARHGAQAELCDGIDNDCDDTIDESPVSVPWYRDLDGDGFGSSASGITISCAPLANHSLLGTDCDDGARGVSPAASEECNGRDDDCNGVADYAIASGDLEDDDGDGFADAACGRTGMDCDDRDPAIHPGAPELCNGVDDDCDGAADAMTVEAGWYPDADGDGFGDARATSIDSCAPVAGRVARAGDCDDSSAAVRPGAPDRCGAGDEDCDGRIDEAGAALGLPVWLADRDRDGAPGSEMDVVAACEAPPGYAAGTPDCDDDDASRAPGLPELCNGRDDDCDASTDEAPAALSCSAPGATGATCAAGACVLGGCAADREDCDGLASSGCEVDTATDRDNCGACGARCDPGAECAASACTSPVFVSLASAYSTTCGVLDNGRVLCWGDGATDQLGAGGRIASSSLPVEVVGIRDASQVSVGAGFACAVTRAGRVLCWGSNSHGQLTRSMLTFPTSPTPIEAVSIAGAVQVVARATGVCARLGSGSVMCWGSNLSGEVGNGVVSSANVTTPVLVSGLSDAIDLAGVESTLCAVRATGVVVCWGEAGPVGQLGLPAARAPTPVEVPGVTGALDVEGNASGTTFCVRLASGRVTCWGANGSGQIGDGTLIDRPLPTLVPGVTSAARIAVGRGHVCVQRADGSVLCSGANTFGERGASSASSSFVALTPAPSAAVVELALGSEVTCVRYADGRAACAGANALGQLGDGTMIARSALTTVTH